MVFEKDLKRILEKYEGKIITKDLIGTIVRQYRKMFMPRLMILKNTT